MPVDGSCLKPFILGSLWKLFRGNIRPREFNIWHVRGRMFCDRQDDHCIVAKKRCLKPGRLVSSPVIPAACLRLIDLKPPQFYISSRRNTPMEQKLFFDPAERRAEKQRQRDADAAALASGEVSREQLSRANGLFSSPILVNRRVVRRYGSRS